ncbi:MAG: VOC family protein [Betaproteobacteria bacterium]|nr:VOC family protein [Betaproteobacteria bacterium]
MEIGARLHHLQLLSPDAGRCAGFYGRAYDMRVRADGPLRICAGHDRRLLVAPGVANRMGFAAFGFPAESAFEAYRRRVESRVPVAAADTPLFRPGAFAVMDPDGNRIVFGVPVVHVPSDVPAVSEAPPARLQHFAFRSSEPSDLLPFYQYTLGFAVSDRVCDGAGRVRACFLRTDAEHHALAIFHAAEARHDHLSFETTEWARLRDWADRMSRLRIPIAWGVGRHGPGNDTFFMIRDPDGNLAEISAELEICASDRAEGRWLHEERTLNLWGSAIMRS